MNQSTKILHCCFVLLHSALQGKILPLRQVVLSAADQAAADPDPRWRPLPGQGPRKRLLLLRSEGCSAHSNVLTYDTVSGFGWISKKCFRSVFPPSDNLAHS